MKWRVKKMLIIKILKLIGYGFLVWLIPTIITSALIIFPNTTYLFDIVSALSLFISSAMFSYLYFKSVNINFIKEGIITGITWLILSIVFDLLMILVGISTISLTSYALLVVPLYVIIPVITVSYGLHLDHKANKVETLKNL
jgi:hypothetical protein